MVMRISNVDWGYEVDNWATWTVGGDVEAVADDLAVRYADGPDAQAVVRRSVIALNADALAKKGIIARQAIWIPDRSTGEGIAMLDMFLALLTDPWVISGRGGRAGGRRG